MFKKIYQRVPFLSLLTMGVLILNTAISSAETLTLSLEDSIALAIKNNPSIQGAMADKEKAVWNHKETEAGKLPTLSLNSSYNRSSGSSAPTDSFSNSLRVSLPVYTGGRVEGQIEQAKLGINIAELGIIKAEEQLKLDTTTAYYNLLQGSTLVKVNQQTVDSLAAHLKNVQAHYEVGTIAKSDVLRSEVELANAQQNLTKGKNSYEVAQAAFNNLIGIPLDTETIIKEEPDDTNYEMTLEDSIQMALTKRPEMAQSQDNIGIAMKGIAIADSTRLPTVAISGNEGLSGSEFPGQNNNWSVGVSASWNLFDGGVTKAKVKEAKANVDKVKAGDAQLRQGVELEVRQAYLSMTEAKARIETAKVAVSKAAEDVKASEAKYYAGVGTNLDVIDAQMALTQANTNVTQATYDYHVNKAKLEKAVGLRVKE